MKTLLVGILASIVVAGQIPAPHGTTVDPNLVYARVGKKDLRLDLYRPAKRDGKLPLVVWIHGGAFRMGSKDSREGMAAVRLTAHGYAVVSIDYRLSQEAKFPAQIEDCKAAVQWLRTNAEKYGLDASRIAAWGASAGAYLAAMLGTSDIRIQAVVDFFGPTDFLQMDRAALAGGQKHDPAESPESRLIGGPIQENKEKVARANPINFVTKETPPFLILHGERDPLVPLNQSELLFDALTKARVNAAFFKLAGAGHGGPAFDTPVVRAMVLAFLNQHLLRP